MQGPGPPDSELLRDDGPSEYPALVHWRCHASDSWQKRPCLGHNLMLPPSRYELESLGEMQKSMRKLEMSRNLKRKTSDDTN